MKLQGRRKGEKRLDRPSFPLAARYAELALAPSDRVREAQAGYGAAELTERHIQCVWYDSDWRPRALRTTDGEPVEVLDPGRWNLEAGPDFLDAELRIGNERRLLRGDVEAHLRAGDWIRHGHADDPAYARVVAHVTYEAASAREGMPSGAVHIPLRKALAANPSFAPDALDVAAYPYALPESPRPCARLLRTWTPEQIAELLRSAGQCRAESKAARMAIVLRDKGPAQALYEEIMSGLGYKKNKSPFRELAARVPVADLRREADGNPMRGYALLLGVAGLMPDRMRHDWDAETRRFVRGLRDAWWKCESAWAPLRLSADAWRLSGIRPANHPRRRLAAAAALCGGTARIEDNLLQAARSGADVKHVLAMLGDQVRMPYWNRRLSFSGAKAGRDIALVGTRRAADLFVNAILPFVAALNAMPEAWSRDLPAGEDNACARQAAFGLFGADRNRALFSDGWSQQGLLRIFYDHCVHGHAACERCRMVAALAAQEPRCGTALSKGRG